MRFILFIVLAAGCSRTSARVAPPAPTTMAEASSCEGEPPAPRVIEVEVKQPAKNVFDLGACR